MQNFSFTTPTKYIFGHDAELNAGAMAANEGMTTVLLVYGGGSAVRSGLLEHLMKPVSGT